MTDEPCPGDDVLLAFLEGSLSEDDEIPVVGHLRDCAACGRVLDRLNAPDPGRLETEVLTGGGVPEAAGRYRPVRELARGGMGIVYLAVDPLFGRDVAVKLLHHRLLGHPGAKARFLDEARITGRLEHPGVPAVHDIGELADGRPFLVMKLIAGRTLAELFAAAADPAAREALLPALLAVCQTVGFAHARGVVHRDLKPANVMVGVHGEIQVLDWGLAKSGPGRGPIDAGAAGPADSVAGSAVGSAPYAAPEQARGETARIDARSDVFGLGAMLAELLTGSPPYAGLDPWAAARAADPGDIRRRLAACPTCPELHALALECLDPAPAARPADADAVAGRLNDYLAGVQRRLRRADADQHTAAARADAERAKNRLLRRSLAAITGLAVAVVATVTIGYVAVRRQAEETARREQDALTALDGERKAIAVSDRAVRLLGDNVVKNMAGRGANPPEADLKLVAAIGRAYDDLAALRRDDIESLETAATGHNRLADFYMTLDRHPEAESHLTSAVRGFEALIAAGPTEERYRNLAAAYNDQFVLRRRQGRDPEAALAAAIATWTTAVEKYPANPDHPYQLASVQVNRGNWLLSDGRPADAVAAYQVAIDRMAAHADRHPGEPAYRRVHGTALGHQSDGLWAAGRPADAIRVAEASRVVLDQARKAKPNVAEYAYPLAEIDGKLCRLYRLAERRTDAVARGQQAVGRLGAIAKAQAARPDYGLSLGQAEVAYGQALAAVKKPAEAEAVLGAAVERLCKLSAGSPTVAYSLELAAALVERAKVQVALQRPADALTTLAEVPKALASVAADGSPLPLYVSADADCLRAEIELARGEPDAARPVLARARATVAKLPAGSVPDPDATPVRLAVLSARSLLARADDDRPAMSAIARDGDACPRYTARDAVMAARLFARHPAPETASVMRLLTEAKSKGWTTWDEIDADADFKLVAQHPDFRSLRGK